MWEIFKTFFKIGLFTFGGGYAMIPLIEEQVVKEKAWLSAEEFVEFLSLSQGLPGAMAVSIANLIGFKRLGVRGQLMACLGTVMPSFLIILTIAMLMNGLPIMAYLQPVMDGMLPAIAVLIVYSAYNLGKKMPRKPLDLVLLSTGLILLIGLGVSPIWVVLGGVAIGVMRSVIQGA